MVQSSFWTICSNKILQAIVQECSVEKYNWWFWNFLHDWQALAAGAIALVGAAVLMVQIWLQRQELKRQRRKEEIQARLLLPHALSNVHRYLEKMGRAWIVKNMTLRPPPISEKDMQVIAASATVADKKTFESVRRLVQDLQTFESRLDDSSPLNYYDMIILDLARVWVLTNSLYDYGRFTAKSAPYMRPNKEELYKALDHPLALWKLLPNDPIVKRVEDGLKVVR